MKGHLATGSVGRVVVSLLCAILAPVAAAVVVEFPDPNLEQAIRYAIDKPEGEIEDTDLVGVGFTELEAGDRDIYDLTGLEYCTDLEDMDLYMNHFTDITPLSALADLRSLDLWATDVYDLSPLAPLHNLRVLGLYDTNVLDYSPILGLPNLEELSIGGSNSLCDISWVSSLTTLTKLQASEAQISDLTPIAGLTGLTRIDISYNPVEDLSPVAGLVALTSLQLWEGHVSDISPLASLINLESLNLGANSITNISALAGLTKLEHLWLTGNLIEDIGPLVANPGIGDADTVRVDGNPLSQQALCSDIPALEALGVRIVDYDGACGQPGPVITGQPSGGFVEEGQPFTLSIELAQPLGARYWWRKDGIVRSPLENEWSDWHFDALTPEDSGCYTCLVSHPDGTVMSQAAYLNVVAEGAMPAAGRGALLISAALLGGAGAAIRQVRRGSNSGN